MHWFNFLSRGDKPGKSLLNNPQYLAKTLDAGLKLVTDKGMLRVWRDVAESGRIESDASIAAIFNSAEKKAYPIFDLNDLEERHMRPVLFHLERSVIPRLYQMKGENVRVGMPWITTKRRMDEMPIHHFNKAAGGGKFRKIAAGLNKPYNPYDLTDPNRFTREPEAQWNLTGYQTLKALRDICDLMIENDAAYKLTPADLRTLRRAMEACDHHLAGKEIALPASAKKDFDNLVQSIADGSTKFGSDGRPSYRTRVNRMASTFDEALIVN